MNEARRRLAEAREREKQAQARLFATLGTVQARAKPARIAGEAWDGARNAVGSAAGKAADAVKKRPGTIAAVGSALALFVFRKKIASAVTSRFGRNKTRKHQLIGSEEAQDA